MKNNSKNKTFLFVNSKKIIITVLDSENQNIYKKESLVKDSMTKINFEFLNEFLNQNIFKIEKILNEFVNNIFLIIDHSDLFSVGLSIKEKTDNISLNTNSISSLLAEARNQCKQTLTDTDVIHMKIDEFCIDDIYYKFLPNKQNCKNFSIDVSFICLPTEITKNFEKIFGYYEISLSKIFSFHYLSNFVDNNDKDIYVIAHKILNGLNENEVFFTNKNPKNEGFFEKFFNFFN